MAGPRITPADLYKQAGINPQSVDKKAMPIMVETPLKTDIKRQLRIIDEQDAVNRFTWTNLPVDLSSQELERLLYYKGSLALFYLDSLDEFMILPFALEGGLDVYGRYNYIHPVPFNGAGDIDKSQKTIAEILATKKFKVLHDVVTPEELIKKPEHYLTECCVIIKDYTPQLSQTITPRYQLQDSVLDVMADCIPFMRTALMNSSGVSGVKTDASAAAQVNLAAQAIYKAALNGERYIPISGTLELQGLDTGVVAKAEEFMLSMQSLDNYRLSTYGLDNGGLFQKKSHMLEAEQRMNQGINSLVMADGLGNRQRGCNIINSVWATGTWCSVSEEAMGIDKDGDMLAETNQYDTMEVSEDVQ